MQAAHELEATRQEIHVPEPLGLSPWQVSPPPGLDFSHSAGAQLSPHAEVFSPSFSPVDTSFNLTPQSWSSPVPMLTEPAAPVEVRGVSSWAEYRVAEWLVSSGLGPFAEAFLDNRITGDLLLELSSDDLAEIGVKALGDRKHILRAIRLLCTSEVEQVGSEAGRCGVQEWHSAAAAALPPPPLYPAPTML